jgi:hypothetical protein
MLTWMVPHVFIVGSAVCVMIDVHMRNPYCSSIVLNCQHKLLFRTAVKKGDDQSKLMWVALEALQAFHPN